MRKLLYNSLTLLGRSIYALKGLLEKWLYAIDKAADKYLEDNA